MTFKYCITHGDLTEDQTIKSGKNGARCKECYKVIRRNNYLKNKEKILNKNRNWRLNNPERNRELNKKYNKERYHAGKIKDSKPRSRKFHLARRRIINIVLSINKVIKDGNKIDC